MAKIVLTLDTESKKLTANVNGVTYNDVSEATVYKTMYDSDDHCYCSIYLQPIEDDGVVNRTSIHAMAKKLAEDGIKIYQEVQREKHWLFK